MEEGIPGRENPVQRLTIVKSSQVQGTMRNSVVTEEGKWKELCKRVKYEKGEFSHVISFFPIKHQEVFQNRETTISFPFL